MKEYPFEIQALCEFEGTGTACYMTKGHHDINTFVEEVKKGYGESIRSDWVKHCYGKHVPIKGSKLTFLYNFKEPVRGSFPMTYIDV